MRVRGTEGSQPTERFGDELHFGGVGVDDAGDGLSGAPPPLRPAEEFLQPTGTLVRGAGEVVSYDPGSDGMTETLQPAIYRALENPTSASVDRPR